MPDVPRQPSDILRAAGDRAADVAGQLAALEADVARPRPAVLGDADQLAGVDALAAAAAALRELAAAIGDAGPAGDACPAGDAIPTTLDEQEGENVEHA
jgi:hypothetical protein